MDHVGWFCYADTESDRFQILLAIKYGSLSDHFLCLYFYQESARKLMYADFQTIFCPKLTKKRRISGYLTLFLKEFGLKNGRKDLFNIKSR